MMSIQHLTGIVLVTILLSFINGQNVSPNQNFYPSPSFQVQQSFPKLTLPRSSINRIRLFTITFINAVRSYPLVLQVFDTTVPSLEVSKQLYKTYHDALISVGANNPASLAKTLADAFYITLPFMSQDTYISIVGRSMAFYMISQDLLIEENTELLALEFCNTIRRNIPTDAAEHSVLIGALSNGIVDVLKSHGDYILKHLAAFTISTADTFYAFSSFYKPQVTAALDPTSSVPDATTVYGIDRFSLTFANCVEYSAVLQSVFFSNESVSVISNAWQTAFDSFCISINCYSHNINRLYKIVSDTYPYMSKHVYTNAISNAYALSLMSLGELTSDNINFQANAIAKSIENILIELPPNAGLATKLKAVFLVLQSLVTSKSNIINQFPVFTEFLIVEFYALTPVSLKIPFILNYYRDIVL